MPSRISSPHGTITLTMGGKAIEFGVEQPQFDFSALRITVTREPPIDTEVPRQEDDLAARVEAYINSARELQAAELRIAGADANGDVLTTAEKVEYLKRWLYGARIFWRGVFQQPLHEQTGEADAADTHEDRGQLLDFLDRIAQVDFIYSEHPGHPCWLCGVLTAKDPHRDDCPTLALDALRAARSKPSSNP